MNNCLINVLVTCPKWSRRGSLPVSTGACSNPCSRSHQTFWVSNFAGVSRKGSSGSVHNSVRGLQFTKVHCSSFVDLLICWTRLFPKTDLRSQMSHCYLWGSGCCRGGYIMQQCLNSVVSLQPCTGCRVTLTLTLTQCKGIELWLESVMALTHPKTSSTSKRHQRRILSTQSSSSCPSFCAFRPAEDQLSCCFIENNKKAVVYGSFLLKATRLTKMFRTTRFTLRTHLIMCIIYI